MKTMRQAGFLLLFGLLSCLLSLGQSTEPEQKEQTQFKIGVNYNTNLNYYGRTDSLRSSGFFPLAELWFNESFYINAAPIFVTNKVSSFAYAGTVTSLGYLFKSENKWLGNIYFLKPFYKESSDLVQSALKAQTGISLTWMNKVVNITGGGDIKFSDKTDFGAMAGIDHVFRLQPDDKSVLVIDPSVNLNAGTQQFTRSYLKKTGGFILFPGNEQLVTESAQQFNILSYEVSVPVIFARGKFQFLFTPAYVIPQNLITVENRPDLSERGKEMFYATIGAKVIF
ncbi:MAG: hypothetical protein EPN92_14520 [Chitinophagaceae bacterium]|nr:MAG: hypothetical protein EPN92_14520 [Chitinophagaceae bacterium]